MGAATHSQHALHTAVRALLVLPIPSMLCTRPVGTLLGSASTLGRQACSVTLSARLTGPCSVSGAEDPTGLWSSLQTTPRPHPSFS